jgi:hypothetical protein
VQHGEDGGCSDAGAEQDDWSLARNQQVLTSIENIFPSRYSNAAWLRMSILTHNLITALKRMALPEEYPTARPKRLRRLIFNTAGLIIQSCAECGVPHRGCRLEPGARVDAAAGELKHPF